MNIVGTQMFPWSQEWNRQKRDYNSQLDAVLREAAQHGFMAWEQSVASASEAEQLQPLLQAHGLQTASVYAGGKLHEDDADLHIDKIMEGARAAKTLGARVVVVNPNPVNWNGPEDKSDAQLRRQARALQTLGDQLRANGLQLAYHTHDAEMRQSAREFHHMMRATSDVVGLCLDAHWIYTGAGHSTVALMDIFGMYADRVKSVHARQSQDGVWSEVFSADGDVPWREIAQGLRARGFSGPVMLEQAIAPQTPHTMPFAQAQGLGLKNLGELFS